MQLPGNRLCFLCKSKPQRINFKLSDCLLRLRQHYKPNVSFSFGGFAFHQLKNKIKIMASPCLAAAGFAIDRLEGDSIKKRTCLHTAWGSVGCHGLRRRNRCWLFTHNVSYRIFFRACLHERG
jgi:hypothetical protein